MICPQCRAEYRRGFTVCRDCDVPLMESTDLVTGSTAGHGVGGEPAPTLGDPAKDPFCSFWKGTDLRVCTEICTVLDEAEIPHKTIRRQDHLFNLNNQTPYEVGVPASLYEQAELAIKEAFGTEGDDAEGIRLLNEQNRESFERLVEEPITEKLKQQQAGEVPSFLESLIWKKSIWKKSRGQEAEQEMEGTPATDRQAWYPDDAKSLVWDGEPPEAREMIEMSLKENDIGVRSEMQDGKPQFFVLPEDEECAKEIVREVIAGQPPE
jgi:hypothetical protein